MPSKIYLKGAEVITGIFASFALLSLSPNSSVDVINGSAREGFGKLRAHKEIALRTGNDLVAEIHQVKLFDNCILLVDKFIGQQVYLFDQAGNLLHKIGKKGQGPGEYLYPLAAPSVNNNIYIAGYGTKRMEVYDRNGKYLKSFPLAGIGLWHDILVDKMTKFYVLGLSRYTPYSISVFDTLGQKVAEFSKIDQDFSHAFDTFYPAGAFVANQNEEIYQVFDHKYEIKVFDGHGKTKRLYRFNSPYYKAPDYEKAKTVHGGANEKKFRSTFTQVVGIHLYPPDRLLLVLRNWTTAVDSEYLIELWDVRGNFLNRFKLGQGQSLMTIHGKYLVVVEEGGLGESGGLENPSIIFYDVLL